jgi:hypothetical protein
MKYIETIREILLSPCFPTNLFFVYIYIVNTPLVEIKYRGQSKFLML